MACDDGQEGHLEKLAVEFDNYVNQLKGSFGEIGDQRLTIMAGIMVTDEVLELKRRVGELENEVKQIAENRALQTREKQAGDDELAKTIEDIAKTIEGLNRRLNGS